MTPTRYSDNLKTFTSPELEQIRQKSVCVVGVGGLGGFVCNGLARFGVGRLTVIDGDVFSESNLNRQLFARPDTIGRPKALVCKEELERINGDVAVTAVPAMLEELNAGSLLSGHDLVIDCLDSPRARVVLEKACEALGLPFVHGAVSGDTGQVAAVFPGDGLMKRLYSVWEEGDSPPGGNPVFSVQAVSALQIGEALKLLAGRDSGLKGRLLHLNLSDYSFELIRA